MPKKVEIGSIITEKDLEILAAARVFAYSLLKRVFLEQPNAEFLKLLVEEELLDNFPGLEDDAEIREGLKVTKSYLARDGSYEGKARVAAVDYTSMFMAPMKKRIVAKPYESIYTSAMKQVWQEETMVVRRIYLKHGLLPKDVMREPEDHIGYELDFMGRLSERIFRAAKRKKFDKAKEVIEAQREFLEDHLLKWVPEFSRRVRQHASTDYFRGLGMVLPAYLNLDYSGVRKQLEAVFARSDQKAKG